MFSSENKLYKSLLLDTDNLKMALRAPKSFRGFRETDPLIAGAITIHFINLTQVSCIDGPTADQNKQSADCHPGYKGERCQTRECSFETTVQRQSSGFQSQP